MPDTTNSSPAPAIDPQFYVRLTMLVAAILLLIFGPASLFAAESEESRASYIVKSSSSERAAELVVEAGGQVTHELKIIRSVGAKLTAAEREELAEHPEISRVWEDREAEVQSDMQIDSRVSQE